MRAMRDSAAISVQGVSKKYRLYSSPTRRLVEMLHPFRKQYHREFWALRDIDFEAPKGSTVGVLGRNGSGKSTLLQIVCSILQPTSGQVRAEGRIAALLELGAGFNLEFTGRENVLFNSLLMGFSKKEAEARLPEVEEFAGIGQFLDQPVRTYSSGMFVRLAFASAINVDPDILVVDEALAVGDAKFQHKCYMKFREFQRAGRTILFVTHDMNAIVKHCDYCLVLEDGEIVMQGGDTNAAVNCYVDLLEGRGPKSASATPESAVPCEAADVTEHEHEEALTRFLNEHATEDGFPSHSNYNENEYRQGPDRAKTIDYLLVSGSRCDPGAVSCGDTVEIYIKARFLERVERPVFGIALKTTDGLLLFGYHSRYAGLHIDPADPGDVLVFRFSLQMNVAPGDVFFDVGVAHQGSSGAIESLDRRCAAIHTVVLEKGRFDGLSDLVPETELVARSRGQ